MKSFINHLEEANTFTLVAKKGSKKIETVNKVTQKELKTVEMLLKTAHGKDIKVEKIKESVEHDEKNFKPHMMYDPKTGKGYKAKTYQDHLDMKKKGYGHTKPEVKESVELDEALTLASDDLNTVKKTAQKLSKQSPDLTYYVVKHKIRHFKGKQIPYYSIYQSVDWHMARSMGAKKVAGYGPKGDLKLGPNESVELDEANDPHAVRDLELYILNNGDIHRQRIQPIIKNYKKKMAKGNFDDTLAIKGFMVAVADGIKAYSKDFGTLKMSKADRQAVAKKLYLNFRDEIAEKY